MSLQAHMELQENMAQTQQQSLGGMQEATTKMISQQAESVRYTAEAARQIKEVRTLPLHSFLYSQSLALVFVRFLTESPVVLTCKY